MSVRKSNRELLKMISRMTLIGTLVVANVLFTMVSHKHIWSQKVRWIQELRQVLWKKQLQLSVEQSMIEIIR